MTLLPTLAKDSVEEGFPPEKGMGLNPPINDHPSLL